MTMFLFYFFVFYDLAKSLIVCHWLAFPFCSKKGQENTLGMSIRKELILGRLTGWTDLERFSRENTLSYLASSLVKKKKSFMKLTTGNIILKTHIFLVTFVLPLFC
jgi:hypothetical protein